MKNERSSRSGQVETLETADEFRAFIRSQTREALLRIVKEELEELCGPRHHPPVDAEYFRSGGVDSPVYVDGRRENLRRPRVRQRLDNGETKEFFLKSWRLARDPEEWEEAMMRAVLCGVSTRKIASLRGSEIRGESKSSMSRLWQKKARELVEEMQESDLSDVDPLVLMIDAVVLCRGLVATVAMSVDTDGQKRILGFRVGSSENAEVCGDLLSGLLRRGFRPPANRRLLLVLDGSQALKKAALREFPRALIQRCLVHKERNIRSYLSKKHWKTLAALFNRLRLAQGAEAAKEAAEAIEGFLHDKNANARASFEECGEELLTLFRLNVPSTLNTSLLSTNAIENVFKNLRRHIGRVCRWREETDQADLWLASGLKLASEGFRRIRNYQDLPALAAALEEATPPFVPTADAGGSLPPPNPPARATNMKKAAHSLESLIKNPILS